MNKYSVHITDCALQDINAIYDYISDVLQAPKAAAKLYNKITETIFSLDTFPQRFRVLNFNEDKFKNLRRTIVGNYSIFFFIENNFVYVTNILYSASDIESRLSKIDKD